MDRDPEQSRRARERKRERRRVTRRSISDKTGRVNRAGFKIFSDVQVIGIVLPVFGRSLITKGYLFLITARPIITTAVCCLLIIGLAGGRILRCSLRMPIADN